MPDVPPAVQAPYCLQLLLQSRQSFFQVVDAVNWSHGAAPAPAGQSRHRGWVDRLAPSAATAWNSGNFCRYSADELSSGGGRSNLANLLNKVRLTKWDQRIEALADKSSRSTNRLSHRTSSGRLEEAACTPGRAPGNKHLISRDDREAPSSISSLHKVCRTLDQHLFGLSHRSRSLGSSLFYPGPP